MSAEIVTSRENPRVKELRRWATSSKHRRRDGVWYVEGVRLAEEVARSGLEVVRWVLRGDYRETDARLAEFVDNHVSGNALVLSRELFREVTATETPQGVGVAFRPPEYSEEEVFAAPGVLVGLDRVQDPGNLGTIARTAEAAGAAGLLLSPGCVDPGNPKALRSSAGALLRLPVLENVDFTDPSLAGRKRLATVGDSGRDYAEIEYTDDFLLLLGQEGSGLSKELITKAGEQVTIPMCGSVESLNVATAGAVILFEAARRKRTG